MYEMKWHFSCSFWQTEREETDDVKEAEKEEVGVWERRVDSEPEDSVDLTAVQTHKRNWGKITIPPVNVRICDVCSDLR